MRFADWQKPRRCEDAKSITLTTDRDESERYKSLSHGPVPLRLDVEGFEQAAQVAREFVTTEWAYRQGEATASVCVIADSEKNREALSQQFQSFGLPCVTISAQSNHADAKNVVHFATMHRAKALSLTQSSSLLHPSIWVPRIQQSSSASCSIKEPLRICVFR